MGYKIIPRYNTFWQGNHEVYLVHGRKPFRS